MHCNNRSVTDKTALAVQVSRQGSAATSGVFSVLLSISQHETTKSFSETWLLEVGDPQELQHSIPQSPGRSYHVFPVPQ